MGEIVDIGRRASARDRKLLGAIVQSAQLAQAYATFERSYFLKSPDDQRRIAERLADMSRDAALLSRSVRERLPSVPWDALIAAGTAAGRNEADPAELWTAVKRIVPRVTSALGPLVGEAAPPFAWTPPPRKPRAAAPKTKRRTSTRGDSRASR
jgi:uncharacterized protein with HEPN domain